MAEKQRLFIGGLPPQVGTEELRELMSRFGSIGGVEIIKEDDGSCRGFGYVDLLAQSSDAQRCTFYTILNGQEIYLLSGISTLNNTRWKGKHTLRIEMAKEHYLTRYVPTFVMRYMLTCSDCNVSGRIQAKRLTMLLELNQRNPKNPQSHDITLVCIKGTLQTAQN